MNPPTTPDGRYFVVRGRLWRATHPALPEAVRGPLVQQLMHARRAVKAALASDDAHALAQARAAVTRPGLVDRWCPGFQPASCQKYPLCRMV